MWGKKLLLLRSNNKQAQYHQSSLWERRKKGRAKVHSGEPIGLSCTALQSHTRESLASRNVDFPTASQMKPLLACSVLYTTL